MKKENNNKTQIFHYDLYGKREDKYDFLNNNSINSINWNELKPEEPNFFFVPKDFGEQESYEKGFKVDEMFIIKNSGVKTDRDNLFIDENKSDLSERFKILLTNQYDNLFTIKYRIEDSGSYKLIEKIKGKIYSDSHLQQILYRPFDFKWIYYDDKLVSRPAKATMIHFKNKNNYGVILPRMCKGGSFQHGLVCKNLIDVACGDAFSGSGTYFFPLYLYHDSSGESNNTSSRTPNLNMEIVNKIAKGLGLTFTPEIVGTNRDLSEKKYNYENKRTGLDLSLRDENVESMRTGHDLSLREIKNTFAPIDILDYIYAVLHSPTYRKKYKEFLKIDFPRVPYPHTVGTNRDLSAIQNKFWQLVKLGGELRQIHLLESPVVEHYITQYPIDGNNEVVKPAYKDGSVYINDTQYFANVPDVAWNFYIGGYQPAQKWLKDRKGRKLDFDDIFHYQKIIVALTETDRIMKEIDEIGIE